MSSTANASATESRKAGDIVSGRYELLRKIGEGAMGSVWVASNKALGSKVAIKLLRPEMRIPMIVERMLREARAAAQVTHSAIVRVFDLGEMAPGDPYFVMELLEGESLGSFLEREGKLTPERALSFLVPIARGMNAAHESGIVHRDLKPDNIMLTLADGGRVQPKVVDFGIVKLQASTGNEAFATGAILLGTPEYMSPEQTGGGAHIDHRSDIWSLCVVLYECLSGASPFRKPSTWEVLSAVANDEAPSLVTFGIDPTLAGIVARGMNKSRDDRWVSMTDLADALEAWVALHGSLEARGQHLPVPVLIPRESRLPPASLGASLVGAAQTVALSLRTNALATRRSKVVFGAAIAVVAAATLAFVPASSGGSVTKLASAHLVDAATRAQHLGASAAAAAPAAIELPSAAPEPDPDPDPIEPAKPAPRAPFHAKQAARAPVGAFHGHFAPAPAKPPPSPKTTTKTTATTLAAPKVEAPPPAASPAKPATGKVVDVAPPAAPEKGAPAPAAAVTDTPGF